MATSASAATCHVSCRSSTCPPWLQAAIADIEQRIQSLELTGNSNSNSDETTNHCFAERAESYYEKRPQLLSLLTDLHNRYLYLADRYSQSLLKSHHHTNSSASEFDNADADTYDFSNASDAESSLSFQFSHHHTNSSKNHSQDIDLIMAELVMAFVNRDILEHEAEKRRSESARKIELQTSLLEVLESERLVLLNENARLTYRAAAAEEEAAELGFMRRRAAEMARLVVKLREEHRVCMFGRKIEGLQAHIYGLEKRNMECFEAMAQWEAEKKVDKEEVERLRAENKRLQAEAMSARQGVMSRLWSKVRMVEWVAVPCVPEVRKEKKKVKEVGYGGCFCL